MLALVLAVVAANYKSTDLNTADYFDDCMRKYMNGVALLFKENSITPSQHSAFHIGQNLREFGPGHSRSAHHYERYIHHLQRQNTNGKFGEIENTFMYSTARMANLKALLSDNGELRTQVAGTVKAYDLIAGLKVLDSNDSHFDLASKAQWGSLSVRERQLLKGYLGQKYTPFDLEDWRASGCIMDQISVDGVKYACQNVSKYDRDSHILFKVPGKEAAPGKILNIVQYWHTTADGIETKDIYLVVDRFDPNPVPPEQDPYRQHPGIFGHLAGVIPVETCIIEASHIQSHFGLTPIKFSDELDVMHVYPLSRAKNQHWQWNEDPGLDNNEDDEMWDEDGESCGVVEDEANDHEDD
ncbi:hypothetical protein B0H13DRAFT_1884135 [Mycena leptocephala]|nr:hypothetical protein B0H13DRAFT_1884135 [Mycena leptocephala]